MTRQFQNTAYIPLIINEVMIVEDMEATVICALDINEEPYVTDIYLDNMRGRNVLHLTDKSEGDEAVLWNALVGQAWEAVEEDVLDQMREAA